MTTSTDDDALLRRASDPAFLRRLGEAWAAGLREDRTLQEVADQVGCPVALVVGFAIARRGNTLEADEVALGEDGSLIIKTSDERLVIPMSGESLEALGQAMQALGNRLQRGDRGH